MIEDVPALQTRGLAVSVKGRWLVKDLDLSLARGEFTAIVGPNGAGKSTLVRALAGLEANWGEVRVGGVPVDQLDLRTRARAIGYLPQARMFHWPMSVAEIVALGRIPHRAGFAGLAEEDRRAITDAMTDTGTLDLADRPATSLSGGERARVALARVLAVAAPIVLADEPIASADPGHALRLLEALARRVDGGVAVIAVLQDLPMVARFADRVLVMTDGEIVADGPPSATLDQSLISEVFGVAGLPIEKNRTQMEVQRAATRGHRKPSG